MILLRPRQKTSRGGQTEDKPAVSIYSGLQTLQWPQKYLTFRNVQLELLTQTTAASLTCFSCPHALRSNSCASSRCTCTSHGGTPVAPTAPRAQAVASGEGSEFYFTHFQGPKP